MRKELEEKLEALKRGETVRPPWLWFYTTKEVMKEMYPDREERDIDAITAGIWHGYSREAQIEIIEKMLKGEDGLMATPIYMSEKDVEKFIEEWKKKKEKNHAHREKRLEK